MRIVLEIDDKYLPSVLEYLGTQVVAEPNPVSKAQRLRPMFKGPEDWVQTQVGNLIGQVVKQHPTEEVEAQLAQIKAIEEGIARDTKPRLVGESTTASRATS